MSRNLDIILQVSHGVGATLEASQNAAASLALKALAESGIINPSKSQSQHIGATDGGLGGGESVGEGGGGSRHLFAVNTKKKRAGSAVGGGAKEEKQKSKAAAVVKV